MSQCYALVERCATLCAVRNGRAADASAGMLAWLYALALERGADGMLVLAHALESVRWAERSLRALRLASAARSDDRDGPFSKCTRLSMAAAGGRRFSARLRARLAAVDEQPAAAEPLLFALVGDPLRAIARLLPDEDRFRARLACTTLRDHVEAAAAPIGRVAFLRTRALAAYAYDALPGFVLADKTQMLELAATVGCVDVLAELTDARGCAGGLDPLGQVCRAAASHGHLEALRWLRARGCPWGQTASSSAAGAGHLEVLRYLHENGCEWNEYTCSGAAKCGHLEVLRYLHDHGCPWGEQTCSAAALTGHLEVLRYAHEHGCPWDKETCMYAAGGGHLEVLRYAHEHGCPWNKETCIGAAEGGHREVLRYAHERGCRWDINTCMFAAHGGHLEVLRYAHEHGCPWDSTTCVCAAAGGHLEVLRYAREHGCPG